MIMDLLKLKNHLKIILKLVLGLLGLKMETLKKRVHGKMVSII
jgi:hypothetical protein